MWHYTQIIKQPGWNPSPFKTLPVVNTPTSCPTTSRCRVSQRLHVRGGSGGPWSVAVITWLYTTGLVVASGGNDTDGTIDAVEELDVIRIWDMTFCKLGGWFQVICLIFNPTCIFFKRVGEKPPQDLFFNDLDGGFEDWFIFNPTWGNDPFWRAYFSHGLVKNHQLGTFEVERWGLWRCFLFWSFELCIPAVNFIKTKMWKAFKTLWQTLHFLLNIGSLLVFTISIYTLLGTVPYPFPSHRFCVDDFPVTVWWDMWYFSGG